MVRSKPSDKKANPTSLLKRKKVANCLLHSLHCRLCVEVAEGTQIVRTVYTVEDKECGYTSPYFYIQASWPAGAVPRGWDITDKKGKPKQPPTRPSVQDEAVQEMRSTPLASVLRESAEKRGGLEGLGLGDQLDESRTKDAYRRGREKKGWKRKASAGQRDFWDEDAIRANLRLKHHSVFSSRLESEEEEGRGWRILLGNKGAIDDFRTLCLNTGKGPKSFVVVDTTFVSFIPIKWFRLGNSRK